jgi:imidazolonepropionase-like amidohydrolase
MKFRFILRGRAASACATQCSVLLAALLTCASAGADQSARQERTAYVGATVWDGEGFRPRDIVVEGDRIIDAPARSANHRVELHGDYVVPPFCEAHNHNLGSPEENEASIARYLREGIFYVGILSNLPAITDPIRHTYNTPTSVDVIFANGPLTASGGHPIRLRELLLERGAYPGFTRETLPGQGYFVIDSEADLERHWPTIASQRPDFIKIVLAFSEEFERRRDDPAYFGRKGLDPSLVPRIVKRAHDNGLRVFAHVESGHDFHVAVAADVDVVAHLPGSDYPTAIDPADARAAAERGVFVITTTMLIERPNRAAHRPALREAQISNLRLLRDAGVTLAAGSDEYGETSSAEIAYLRTLGVFSDIELLRMWTTNCARTLFPDRRVGGLDPGNEASFLVLDADPLANFEAVRDIRLRVKQGAPLGVMTARN